MMIFEDGSESPLYNGLLKDIEKPKEPTYILKCQAIGFSGIYSHLPCVRKEYPASLHPLYHMHATGFPSCCAITVIQNFKSLTAQKVVDHLPRIVHTLKEAIEGIQSSSHAGKYIMITLNQHELQTGIEEVLIDYFGFTRLENPFKNLSQSRENKTLDSKIVILGLNTGEYCDPCKPTGTT